MIVKTKRAVMLIASVLPLAAFAGSGSIDRKVAATANGEVVISNVSGSIDVRGWDRNEVQVNGHLGSGVERLDVESNGGRTVVKVVLLRGSHDDGEAEITVSVPKDSSVEVSAVSADVSSRMRVYRRPVRAGHAAGRIRRVRLRRPTRRHADARPATAGR